MLLLSSLSIRVFACSCCFPPCPGLFAAPFLCFRRMRRLYLSSEVHSCYCRCMCSLVPAICSRSYGSFYRNATVNEVEHPSRRLHMPYFTSVLFICFVYMLFTLTFTYPPSYITLYPFSLLLIPLLSINSSSSSNNNNIVC